MVFGWARRSCSLEGDVFGREFAPSYPDSHSFFPAPTSEPEGSCFIILQGASLWMAEASGAPREGGAAGIWTEREQQWFSFVVVGMDVT